VRLLDEMHSGTIRRVEVRAGIPRRIILESQVGAPQDHGPGGVGGPHER
jgi:hypothetical protein